MTFSIRSLLAVTTAIAAVLGAHLAFRSDSHPNFSLWLGWYLVVVSLLSTACLSKSIPLPGAFRAATIFGWTYFVFVLKAGFGIEALSQAQEVVISIRIGLVLIVVSFLVAATVCMFAATPKAAVS
jgi:hypothetical protein